MASSAELWCLRDSHSVVGKAVAPSEGRHCRQECQVRPPVLLHLVRASWIVSGRPGLSVGVKVGDILSASLQGRREVIWIDVTSWGRPLHQQERHSVAWMDVASPGWTWRCQNGRGVAGMDVALLGWTWRAQESHGQRVVMVVRSVMHDHLSSFTSSGHPGSSVSVLDRR